MPTGMCPPLGVLAVVVALAVACVGGERQDYIPLEVFPPGEVGTFLELQFLDQKLLGCLVLLAVWRWFLWGICRNVAPRDPLSVKRLWVPVRR